jgi:hypothetical protein
MIRKFKFEHQIYESLNCLPMAARRKLDALGIKISLAQWEQLGRGERLMICHAPSGSEDERQALRTFIGEATFARRVAAQDSARRRSPIRLSAGACAGPARSQRTRYRRRTR